VLRQKRVAFFHPQMAWRFHEHILRGELDNTVRGRVTGRIWLAGIAEPMMFDSPPDELTDEALPPSLWQLLPVRSRTDGIYFYNTIGSYGPENMEIYERYYETEEQRARNRAQFPNSTPTPPERPPFSRDWRAPKGPF